MRIATGILSCWLTCFLALAGDVAVAGDVALTGLGADTSPRLVFNAGGHTAAVNKVCFSPDGQVFSVSNDKTIRVWDIRTGETRHVLRPPIGPAGRSFVCLGRLARRSLAGGRRL